MNKADEIKLQVAEKYQDLMKMDRQELLDEYRRMTGIEPHPHFERDFMAKAVTRWYQNQLWTGMAGGPPMDIVLNDMAFWLNNAAYFSTKESVKRERSRELEPERKTREQQVIPGAGGSGLQGGSISLDACIIHASPEAASDDPVMEKMLSRLRRLGGSCGYAELAKWAKKNITGSFQLLVFGMKSKGLVELRHPEPKAAIQQKQIIVERPLASDFPSVIANMESASPPTRAIDPNVVDFGDNGGPTAHAIISGSREAGTTC
jgi:hypothetical protein